MKQRIAAICASLLLLALLGMKFFPLTQQQKNGDDMLFFITGNPGKFKEVKQYISNVSQLDIDLPEIQETDAKAVIEAKIEEAFRHHSGPFLVEDTSLYLDCLNGLPGPLIKWFLEALGDKGIYDMVSRYNNPKALAKTFFCYAKSPDDFTFFEGTLPGSIVEPRGESGFGWDRIFQPEGHSKTFAEMTLEEKNTISMRIQAIKKLQQSIQ